MFYGFCFDPGVVMAKNEDTEYGINVRDPHLFQIITSYSQGCGAESGCTCF
jgi:hypothetical protein